MSTGNRIWRVSLVYRVYFGLFGLMCAAGAVLPWDGVSSYWHDLGTRLLLLACSAFFVCLIWRPRMEIRDGELVLRYMLTTRVIPLHTVVNVTPGRSGLGFETQDGASYSSPSLIGEKAPLMTWLRRRTAADGIADTVMAARGEA